MSSLCSMFGYIAVQINCRRGGHFRFGINAGDKPSTALKGQIVPQPRQHRDETVSKAEKEIKMRGRPADGSGNGRQ